ncbi:MAG: hypothetical protein MJZ76_10215 [Bacteroidales bacterium]|nr:hypothetical protein [Bacteroidales bacterium]
MANKQEDKQEDKLTTGIDGLDSLFFGGIYNNNGHTAILVRGEHGVNKIHLAMQMCEGLNNLNKNWVNENNKKDEASQRDVDKPAQDPFEQQKSEFNNKIKKLEDYLFEFVDNYYRQNITPDKKRIDWLNNNKQFILLNFLNIKSNDFNSDINDVLKNHLNELNELIENHYKNSESQKDDQKPKGEQDSESEMVFISINKDMVRLKNIYKGYHICRLIENIAIKKDNWKEDLDELLKSVELKNPEETQTISPEDAQHDLSELSYSQLHSLYLQQKDPFCKDPFCKELQKRFSSGLYYFNTRTLCLYEKRKINNQDIPIANLTEQADSKIQFIGKNEPNLTEGNSKIDNLTLFYNVLNHIEKIKDKTHCIIIDGLSKLSANDIEQINFQALTELLKKKCYIAIITADNKLPISRIGTDIVIEMRISNDERMEYAYRELCITKCLYQKNVYGWHKYRMMNKGIEVFPSIHKQLAQRNYMDNAVSEAMLPIKEPSFPYWISEHKDPSEKLNYDSYKKETNPYEQLEEGKLLYISVDSNLKETIRTIIFHVINHINKETAESSPLHHILFIDLKRSKKQFYEIVQDIQDIQDILDHDNKPIEIHFFSFRPGCIYPDEFLYTIKQQIDAIEREIIENHEHNDKYCDKYIHVVLGDMAYIKYAYPCLENEKLLIPAFASLTRNRHMTNYIYYQKEEKEERDQPFFIEQLKAVADEEIHNYKTNTIWQTHQS